MSSCMLRRASILAVVVAYHPYELFPERFERLVQQVPSVLIVDNHSDVVSRPKTEGKLGSR